MLMHDNGDDEDENDEEEGTHHGSVHIPECSLLTVEYFSLNFISLLVHSV